jgi:hypothetical protein
MVMLRCSVPVMRPLRQVEGRVPVRRGEGHDGGDRNAWDGFGPSCDALDEAIGGENALDG